MINNARVNNIQNNDTKKEYPFMKPVLTYLIVLVFLMAGIWLTIWFMKFTAFKPAKVALVTIEGESEDAQGNFAIDFPKLSALQKEYFSIAEPEKFIPQNAFKIYDTQLLTSLQDKAIDIIEVDKLIEKPKVETILLDDLWNPITNQTTTDGKLTGEALREKLKKERELKERFKNLRK